MQRREATIDKLTKEVEEARQQLEFAKHRVLFLSLIGCGIPTNRQISQADDIDKQLDAYKTLAAADRSQLEEEVTYKCHF